MKSISGLLFESPVVCIDIDGNVVSYNESFKNSYNLELQKIGKLNWLEIDVSLNKPILQKIRQNVLNKGQIKWNTYIYLDSVEYKVNITAKATEKYNSYLFLQILPWQNSKFARFLEKSNDSAYWYWNFINGQLIISKNFATILSIPTNSSDTFPANISQALSPILSTTEILSLQNSISKAKRNKSPLQFTWQFKGQQYKLNAAPTLLGEKVSGFEGIIKKFKNAPEKPQSVIRNAIEKTQDLVLILNEELNISYANLAAVSKLGFSKSEFAEGMNIMDFDIEHTRQFYDQQMTQDDELTRSNFTTIFIRKNHKILPLEIEVILHEESDAKSLYLRARDISSERIQQSQLNASLAHKELTSRRLLQDKSYLLEEATHSKAFKDIISVSKSYKPILHQIDQVSNTDATVLIEGETGTGKELIARAIHNRSQRSKNPLIVVNCGSLPRDLIESELFGHTKGAFTGALQSKKGKFELADNSTIFLDEIGELPLDLQTRLLRVLQEGEVEKIGSEKTIKINTRIIAATNQSLFEMVEEKKFRKDLYYRLNVFPIINIPLRERKEDIEILANHFIKKYSIKLKKTITTLKPDDLNRLRSYHFPGNIRELENIIERSVILTQGRELNLDFWSPNLANGDKEDHDIMTLDEIQKVHIIDALEKTKWRISGDHGAARLLGLKDQTLFSKMRKFEITRN
ncbi:sigma-54 interaction domain-containing protein [Portibacter marinus]|uniref:sigma-54 interaction domain-containing protein n=1 Tax=Portibacter marinus TaxID=2898660 RepID=UPI001F1D8552|nr:sigma 54-interacting transcriptional regulator [Portibacter marinus]